MDREGERQNIPLDIVHEILLNLSVRTLIKFQCVSKQWCSLISHPSFQQDHFGRRSQQDPLLLITSNKVSLTPTLHLSTYNNYGGDLIDKFSLSLSVPHRNTYTLTIRSCRGLVCISDCFENKILVCNPSTRVMISLPPHDEPSHNIGFGYAASTKEFKVVRFFIREDSNGRETYCCEVFTLGSSGWREPRCPPPLFENGCSEGAPFLNGALHLLPADSEDSNADISIYAFDIESEECTKIHLPVSYPSVRANPDYVYMHLTELGGKLGVTCDFGTTLEIWLLKDYGSEEWVKEYTIDITSVGSGVWGEPFTTMRDGSILMSIGTQNNELLYCYDPCDKSFTLKTTEKGLPTLYVESFFSHESPC